MEYFIAIFVGVWVSVAGLMAYHQIKKDFSDVNVNQEEN